ncbi:MAG: hypothetical protein ACPGRW_06045 [Flavobacteriaceae bacterium]
MDNVFKEVRNIEEPKRFNYALDAFKKLDIEITSINASQINIIHKNEIIRFFPYTGWHSGKSIKDGRGIKKLINQLK